LKSGKIYVGSSVNLGRRFRDYYNYTFLEGEIKKNNSMIYKALVKYGYSSFKLDILEYCKPDILIEREQYYLDLLNPEYNILKKAGSLLGFRHSEASRELMKEAHKASPAILRIHLQYIIILLCSGIIGYVTYLDTGIGIYNSLFHSVDSGLLLLVKPVVVYANADIQKESILKENKGKSGVYRWVNKETGKSYVGSGTNLARRFYNYYSAALLIKHDCMVINRALLKYGYSNFTLEILEYCEPSNVIAREQFYLDLLKPEYNILAKAGSSLGFKHTEETKQQIGEAFKGLKQTEETKRKMSEAQRGRKHSEETKEKIRNAHNPGRFIKGQKKREGAGRPSQAIEVIELETGNKNTYESTREAGRALNIDGSIIARYLRDNQKKPYKGRYIFTKINLKPISKDFGEKQISEYCLF
jgi:group I intron endonuclease